MAVIRPDIFRYLDFRAYLEDAYWASKEADSRYSYRYFADKAGYRSPSFLLQIINGEKNLTAKGVDGVARAFELRTNERGFFGALVDFAQAKTLTLRNDAFDRMCASRRFKRVQRLEQTWFDALSHWHLTALREMVRLPDFSEDPQWAADRLSPPVSPGQVASALTALLDAGLLERGEDARLRPSDRGRGLEGPLVDFAAARHHQQMVERAVGALDLHAPRARHLVTHTAVMSEPTFSLFKARLDALLEEFAQASDSDPAPDAVYQLHAAVFPMSKPQPT